MFYDWHVLSVLLQPAGHRVTVGTDCRVLQALSATTTAQPVQRLRCRPHDSKQGIDRFSWNAVLVTFTKICWENPNVIKIARYGSVQTVQALYSYISNQLDVTFSKFFYFIFSLLTWHCLRQCHVRTYYFVLTTTLHTTQSHIHLSNQQLPMQLTNSWRWARITRNT
jgi:hypothetical protein